MVPQVQRPLRAERDECTVRLGLRVLAEVALALVRSEWYLGAMEENTTTAWPLPLAPQKTPLLWRPTTLYQL